MSQTQPDNNLLADTDVQRYMALTAARAGRDGEALKLYRARQNTVPFHSSRATVKLIRGGNRSGKSTAAAAEFASFLTGAPIIGPDGTPISPPRPQGRLRTWVIGYDLKHIGQTIHRLLLEPGLFKIIKDKKTKQWRAWRGWEDPEDAERHDETKPSPPLIPERMIDPKGWGWEDKGDKTFNVCRLKNGNQIFAFGSRSRAKQGDTVHRIWIDEDIEYPEHVDEWVMRVPDVGGDIIWSAMPHERNDALIRLSDQAFTEQDLPEPNVTEIRLTFSGNPYIGAKERNTSLALLDEDARLRRDLGEYDKIGRLVFPTFSDVQHGMNIGDWILTHEAGRKWCRYMVVDPGWARCAATFWAVSPPDVHPRVFLLEDELYLEHANAREFAEAAQAKMANRCYQAFIIDDHGSRFTEMGSGQTVRSQYTAELRKLECRSVETGSDFEPGCDNKDFRILCFRRWLGTGIETNGEPIFRFIRDTTPAFQKEITRYRRKIGPRGDVLDEPEDRWHSHLMVTCQYFAAAMNAEHREPYRPPISMQAMQLNACQKYLQQKRERQRKQRPYVNLGPEEISRSYQFV